MARFRKRPLAAAVWLAFTAPLAHAQVKPGEQTLPEVKVQGAPEPFSNESTGTATRTDTPMRDIPQTVNTVTKELIRSQGASSLSDALRNVPGISYAAPEGGTQANFVYYLRGVPAGGDLFLDGIRDLGEYNRDLFNVEQVEVLKGPSSLMFGRGSTGGVIHQLSKTPTLLPIKELSGTLGSFDKKRFTADFNLRSSDSNAWRLNALHEDSGSYRYPQDVKRQGIAPSWRMGIGSGTDLTLSYVYLKTRDVTDYGQPTLFTAATGFFGLAPISPRNFYGFANHDYTEHETHIATAKLDKRISDNLTLRNTLRWAGFKRRMEATHAVLNAKDANNNAVTINTPLELLLVDRDHNKARDNDDTALINQTELTWKLTTGAIKHTVLGGLELARERLDRNTYTFAGNFQNSLTPLLNPDPYTSLGYTKTPLDRFKSAGDTVAVYAQDQVELSQHWKALVGLRWERYAAEVRQTNINTGAVVIGMDGHAVDFSRIDSLVSSRAGLIWQPTRAQSYYVSYGNSYNPSGELGVYGGTATNLNAQTASLDPERNLNLEGGAQWDWAGLRLRSALFRNDKTNARMADPITGDTILAGKRRVEGVEAELTGRINPRWDINVAMAIMTGKIVTGPANVEGKKPLGVPSNSGSLWTVYRLGEGWEAGGGLFWSTERWLDDQNRGQTPGYHRADLMLGYVQRKYELRLNLNNVTDERYYYGGYQNNPNRVLPGSPREVVLTMRYRFD